MDDLKEYEYVCEECAVVNEELRSEADKRMPATCAICGGVAHYDTDQDEVSAP